MTKLFDDGGFRERLMVILGIHGRFGDFQCICAMFSEWLTHVINT